MRGGRERRREGREGREQKLRSSEARGGQPPHPRPAGGACRLGSVAGEGLVTSHMRVAQAHPPRIRARRASRHHPPALSPPKELVDEWFVAVGGGARAFERQSFEDGVRNAARAELVPAGQLGELVHQQRSPRPTQLDGTLAALPGRACGLRTRVEGPPNRHGDRI